MRTPWRLASLSVAVLMQLASFRLAWTFPSLCHPLALKRGVARLQVRQLSDSAGDTSVAGPSIAVQMIGLNAVPVAGDEFCVCESEQQARQTLLTPRTKCMCC